MPAEDAPAEDAPAEQPYRESADVEWTEAAFEMLERGELFGEVISHRGVLRSRVWGPCPRCGHSLDDKQTHTAVTSFFADGWRGPGNAAPEADQTEDPPYYQVDVSCGCGDYGHAGAPAGKAGCGVSFRVELPLQPGKGSGRDD